MKYCLFAIALLLPATALAGQQEADQCAASLPEAARMIYAASLPRVAPGADLRDIVKTETRKLVKSGRIARSGAVEHAEAAGACLLKI